MKRRLAAIEQMMWRGALETPANFAVTACINGQVTADDLRAALHRLIGRHAHLSLRVEIDSYNRVLFTSEGVGDFAIRQTARGDWTVEAECELRTPFDWSHGPLVRFVLMKDASHTDLMVVCHHCAADGMSGAFLLRDILQTIAETAAPLEPLPELPGVDRLMPAAILEGITNPAETSHLRPLIAQGKDRPSLVATAGSLSLSENRIVILAWALESAETAALLERCKAEKAGVHGVLCTAFMLAFAACYGVSPDGRRRVSSPVSLRDRLSRPVGEAFGMFITPQLIIEADCSPGRSFWDIARDLMVTLKHTASDQNLFAPHLAMRDLLKLVDDERTLENTIDHDVAYDLAVTNLGVLDFPQKYGTLELAELYGPTVNGYSSEKILGVATLGGKMFLNFIVAERVMARAEVEYLTSTAMQILRDAIGRSG